MTQKNKRRKLLSALCLSVVLCTLISCVKEQEQTLLQNIEDDAISVLQETQRNAMLPVDLSMYNLLSDKITTKNSNSEAPQTSGSLYALSDKLQWQKTKRRVFHDGATFLQVPIYSSDSAIMAAVSTNMANTIDSIVPAKFFYIVFENSNKSKRSEYLVTMIPTPSQYNTRPDYDFLCKPNFSGVIIYSDTAGKYLYNRIFTDGLMEKGKIYTSNEPCASNSIYASFFAKSTISTKSEDGWCDTLEEAYVIATRPQNNYHDFNIGGRDEEHGVDNSGEEKVINYETEDPGRDDGGGGEQYLSFIIELKVSGCINWIKYRSFAKGSFTNGITLSTSVFADILPQDAYFVWWKENGCVVSVDETFTIYSDNDRTFTAKYISKDNKDCYKLAQVVKNVSMLNEVKKIKDFIKNSTLERACMGRKDGSVDYSIGAETEVKTTFKEGVKYRYRFHSHAHNGNSFTSGADLYTLWTIISKKKAVNNTEFIYGTIVENQVLCLYIYDEPKFKGFFNAISTNEATLKKDFRDKYKSDFLDKIMNSPYETIEVEFTKYIDRMGLRYFKGNYFIHENGTEQIAWSSLRTIGNSIFDISGCF